MIVGRRGRMGEWLMRGDGASGQRIGPVCVRFQLDDGIGSG